MPPEPVTRRWRGGDAWLLGAFLAAYLGGAVAYLARDSVPPRWDSAGHLLHALDYRDLLLEGRLLGFAFKHYAYYPPFVYQVTGLLHALLGAAPAVAYGVSLAFAATLLLATYRLGRVVASREAGLLAGACVLLLPIVSVFARDCLLDIPLAAICALALVLVVEGPLDSNRRAALFGLVLGIGLLTKWTFALALAGPLAALAWAALQRHARRRARLLRLGLCLGLAAALAAPWYAWNHRQLQTDLRPTLTTVAEAERDPAAGSARYFLYYAESLVQDCLYLPLALLLAAVGARGLRRHPRLRRLLNLGLWPFYVLITLLPAKDPRYAFPLLPVLAVWVAAGVLALERAALRRGVLLALCGGLTLQHIAGLVDLGGLSAKTMLCAPGGGRRVYDPADPPVYFVRREPSARYCLAEWTVFNPFSYFGHLPRREDWQTEPIVALLPDGARVWLATGNDVHLSEPLVLYAARRQGRRIVVVREPGHGTVLLWKGAEVPAAALPFVRGPCRHFVLPDEARIHVCPTTGG